MPHFAPRRFAFDTVSLRTKPSVLRMCDTRLHENDGFVRGRRAAPRNLLSRRAAPHKVRAGWSGGVCRTPRRRSPKHRKAPDSHLGSGAFLRIGYVGARFCAVPRGANPLKSLGSAAPLLRGHAEKSLAATAPRSAGSAPAGHSAPRRGDASGFPARSGDDASDYCLRAGTARRNRQRPLRPARGTAGSYFAKSKTAFRYSAAAP